jgi:biopolymer transport protein ExbB
MGYVIILTDIVEKLILLTLLGLSVWSVSIMIDRRRLFQTETKPSFDGLRASLQSKDRAAALAWCKEQTGFVAGALSSALMAEGNSESVDRAVSSFAKLDRLRLEKGLTVLATLGANAPFIGLFGTVLGIIRSFAYLGSQSGSAAVMSGVSQALYATAVGLFVAIPAVVSYNIFSKKIKDLVVTTESLRDLYVSQMKD